MNNLFEQGRLRQQKYPGAGPYLLDMNVCLYTGGIWESSCSKAYQYGEGSFFLSGDDDPFLAEQCVIMCLCCFTLALVITLK